MEYERYNRYKSQRPFGMGAFFDYGLALARHFASQSSSASAWRSSRAIAWGNKRLAAPQAQQVAEERWDAEGGISQTRIARRAARYER